MTRGHGWSLSITMRGTFTPYSLPAFTGAFDLTPILFTFQLSAANRQGYLQKGVDTFIFHDIFKYNFNLS
jgi:hypothetical protein